ncbi:unnamed protein product [Adineta ricciae]|uniref:Uncharacterized protein n=1 Tax=Adineta ricciae TaxID=249248 RepID=A0A813PKS7_ADIRI|nr:unnamed protein product [Adineta ricciae]CAF1359774.1 unnamed protein product [Adineta ricciae]
MLNNNTPSPQNSKSLKLRALFFVILFISSCLLFVRFDLTASRMIIQNMFNPLIVTNQKHDTNATSIKSNDTQVIDKTRNLNNESKFSLNTNDSNQPKEAFVTFCNNNQRYLDLLKVLLDSVHTFSTRHIIAFGIDVDLNIDPTPYPRLIKRRISQRDCGPSVYFCKIHAIVSSNVDYGVLMETDDVVNYNVDLLFDVLHVWPYPVPLSPRHPDDPQNYHHFMRQFNVSKRSLPYIHAHMIWNYHAIPFLRNLRELLRRGHFHGSNYDETAVNVMLWHAKANYTLCKYDPFFTFSEAYELWPNITNCTRYCHTVFITLHGSKDAPISAALLERLKTMRGKPTVQTPGMGGLYHLNDTRYSCCYPDSKPSSIHPLLCQHNLL